MPVSSSDAPASTAAVPVAVSRRRRSLRSLLGTITGICFIFGGLLAVQLRTIKNIQLERENKKQNDVLQVHIAERNRMDAEKAARTAEHKRAELVKIVNALRTTNGVTGAQVKALTSQIRELQSLACLTPVTGPGLRIVLSDNPQAAAAGVNSSIPLPGLVHDYDVLQVVNELRAAKADAIAVRGAGGKPIRITGTTPIRCVGPVIFINWKPVAAPFSIEATGDTNTLKSAVEMPGGIVENMRTQGAVGVKVAGLDQLTLPPADSDSNTTTISASIPGITSLAPKGA